MSRQKAKGTAAETAVLKFLQDEGFLALRNPPAGARDKGDLTIYLPEKKTIIVEVKNHRRMELAEWVDETFTEKENAGAEAGIVVHKRVRKGQPKDWYVTMTLQQFSDLFPPRS